jgi:saccharopine dehydrogenase (NADP+, L-glutamate forming)/spermidine synthase
MAMKQVLVLGAGLVARPYVQYMLKQGYHVTVASRTVAKAKQLIADNANGTAIAFDIDSQGKELPDLVKFVNLTVSLLPYTYHPQVAEACIRNRVDMVTTSYVSDAMRALDAKAKKAGIILLNECGVDPGQDHMSAMQIIQKAQASGGHIVEFTSYCGGLPAPDANTNPFGYKFSWSPHGVLLAGRNSARFLKDGKEMLIPAEELFTHCEDITVPGVGTFKGYPNRDSLQYIDLYGIHGTKTMLRGTLRYPGWCETMYALGRLGLLDTTHQHLAGTTYANFMRKLVRAGPTENLKQKTANLLKMKAEDRVISRFEWLGLFSDTPIPLAEGSPLDVVCALMEAKLQYAPGERDMLIMQHKFTIHWDDGRMEQVRSTLVDYGIPNGDSSMSRTVALPAAIASRLILEGQLKLKGVQIPIHSEIYKPILTELAEFGIRFKEERTSGRWTAAK